MFTFLLVLHGLIAAALVAVILMQRSEGGGLGTGTGPAGLMTARGAADFLTRTTAILAFLFVGMSVVLAAFASVSRAPGAIDTTFAREAKPMAPVTGGTPAGALPSPLGGLPGGVPGVPAPGATGLTAPETPAPTTVPSDTTERSAQRSDTRSSDEESGASTSKKRRSDSADERNGRSSSNSSGSSSKPSTQETPKSGTLTPSAPAVAAQGSGSPSSSTGASAAPAPKASSVPVISPTPPVSTGSGNSQ